MSAPSRRATGRWYRRVVAPLLVLAIVAGLYLLALSGLGHVAFGAFLVNNDVAATRAATAMSTIGVVERYRGPFAAGTVAAAHAKDAADLAAAEELLREALALADPAGECAVRYNLALVLEAAAQEVEKGEQPDAAQVAEAGYREAAAVAAAAPAECAQVASGHDATNAELPSTDEAEQPSAADEGAEASAADEGEERSAADDLEEAEARASASADAAAERAADPGEDGEGGDEGEPTDDQPDPTQPPAPSDRHSELEQRMGQAHELQLQMGQDGGDSGGVGDGAAQVPAPW